MPGILGAHFLLEVSRECTTQRKTAMANTYTISDLAKEFDLTTRAIRFYEDMGLLQPSARGQGGATACIRTATARA